MARVLQLLRMDVQLADPSKLPFHNEAGDILVGSSCFEHSEMFWRLFQDVLRVLRPQGLFSLNAPNNGPFHLHQRFEDQQWLVGRDDPADSFRTAPTGWAGAPGTGPEASY